MSASHAKQYIIAMAAVAALAIFAPYVPTSSLSVPDPVNNTDKRVRVALTNDELLSVLRTIRRGRFNSVYEIVRFDTRRPLLMIAPPSDADIRAKAQLDVMVGEICGSLCGSGEHYYLSKVNGEWQVVGVSEWVS
ncbi:hypothetical protein [Lysobacter humi (ex Lee et al. 2017)]